MESQNVESEIILKKGYRILEKTKSLKKFLSGYNNVYLNATGKATSIKETIRLIYSFLEQTTKIKEAKAFEKDFLSEINAFSFVDSINAHVILLQELVETGIDILEHNVKPQLSINEKQVLSGLREDLNKLQEEGLNKDIVKNITIALEELERPKHLTCAMVSARATLAMIEYIQADGTKDEDKAKKLEELGVIDKGEESKQTYKYFLEAGRSARNMILHEIGCFPDYTEANNFLSSSLRMAKLYLKYKNTINSPKKSETSKQE